MQTIQLQIEDTSIAKKILSIIDVFKDDGVYVQDITNSADISKNMFENDIKQSFRELKDNQAKSTNKFVKLEV
jgi:hypothetical protein